jgi:hypothetical protein
MLAVWTSKARACNRHQARPDVPSAPLTFTVTAGSRVRVIDYCWGVEFRVTISAKPPGTGVGTKA